MVMMEIYDLWRKHCRVIYGSPLKMYPSLAGIKKIDISSYLLPGD